MFDFWLTVNLEQNKRIQIIVHDIKQVSTGSLVDDVSIAKKFFNVLTSLPRDASVNNKLNKNLYTYWTRIS